MGLEKLGIDEPGVIMAMGGYAGGIASSGRVCGALLGGLAAISRRYSRANPNDKEDPLMWRLSWKLSSRFEELTKDFGGSSCFDIARVDWKDREQVKGFYKGPDSRRGFCMKVVGDTAEALGELLESAQQKG